MRRNLCVRSGPRNRIIVLVITLWPYLAAAQGFHSSGSAGNPGLGAYSRNFRDVLSAADNPAALVSEPGISAGMMAERRFMLSEMNQYSLAGRFSGKNAGFGLQVKYGGYAEYNETKAGLAYARDLGRIRIGGQLNYHHISIEGYGSAGTYSADLAFTWDLTDQLVTGIQVINLVPVFFGPVKAEQYASVYKLGTGYEISGKCYLAGEVLKETGKTMNVQLTLQYQFIQQFFMRLGLNTDVGRPFAGFGWRWKEIRLDITGSFHPRLGITPGMMLIYSSTAKKG